MNALKIFGLISLFIAIAIDTVAMGIEVTLLFFSPETQFHIAGALMFSLLCFIWLFNRICKSI